MMTDYDNMPILDHADPAISDAVTALRLQVQHQGDPLVTLRLDKILFIDDPKEKVKEIQRVIADVQWR